jgi:hypothetical protein
MPLETKVLGAVQNPVVPVVLRGGADALEVGSGAWLGHRDRRDDRAVAETGQPAPLLLLGRRRGRIGTDHVVVQTDGEAGGVRTAELLGEHGAVAVVGVPAASVLLLHGEAEQALPVGGRPDLAGDDAVLLPLLVMRQHLLVQEGADGLPEGLVVLGEDLAFHAEGS